MDKVSSDRERSSRRSHGDRDHHRDRDRDRDSAKDHHRDRDRDRGRDRDRHHDRHRSTKEDDYSPSERDSRRERSSSRARDSVEREVSVERHHHSSSSRKRKDYEEERDRERESKKSRASEERNGSYREEREDGRREERKERREGRRFSDKKDTDERRDGNHVKDDGFKERDKIATNGEHKSGSKSDEAVKEPQTVKPAAPSAVPHPITTKVSSIPSTNENEGVSIRSDEVTAKYSTDGGAPTAGKSTTLSSLDALAKAKKALQLQKELKEKLKKLPVLNKTGTPSSDNRTQVTSKSEENKPAASEVVTPVIAGIPATAPNLEAVKRAQELAARMGFRQDPEFAPLINMFPGSSATDLVVPQKPSKVPVLRLDAQGREIDEHGNVINMTKPTNLSTLKVNINKQKKEAFQIIKPDFDAIAESTSHFDPRMGINKNKLLRPKRPSFQFVEEGQMTKMAEIQRIKSQFGEAQAKEMKVKQAQLAKAKAEPDINPNLIAVGNRVITKQKPKEEEIPDIEWWDKPLLKTGQYEDDVTNEKLNMEKITHYIEHPRPIEPPAEPAPPPPQPLKLTTKERKKLRTQTRIAKEKDRQEMIRQGLMEPPKPKVKMSNLMRVLGSEATQDPTRLEMEIRTAAAEREQAHVDRNTARKLTPAERREKKERKLFDDPYTLETLVSVYKIRDLSDPKVRFKVDMNARQNRMTGVVVRSDGMTVVVVEGGKKSIKRYSKLMLNRIDWSTVGTGEEGEDEEMDEDKPPNSCVLVWQGSVAKPSFHKFIVHDCRSEAAGRKVFADAGVPHYWDLAVNYTEE